MSDAHLDIGGPRPARRSLLGQALGTVAVLAVAAVGATHYLAGADLAAPRREAMRRDPRALPDPETTGAIAREAAGVRLDPCRVAARFPAAP